MKKFFEILKLVFKSFFRSEYTLTCYLGVPGSGKSTFAAYIARKILKKNGKVWSNFPIKGCLKLEPKDDIGIYEMKNGHVIIDEAGLEYNNRDFRKFTKQATEFFKLHRHNKLSVYVFSQGDDVDLKIRNVASRYYVCSKSIIPFLMHRRTYAKKFGVDEITHQLTPLFYKVPFGHKWIFAPSLWLMFNSWSAPKLPEKEWQVWE